MVMSEPRCAKCNTTMEEGILLDFGHGNRMRAVSWAAGPVERSFWRGLKIAGKPRFEVHAFRCPVATRNAMRNSFGSRHGKRSAGHEFVTIHSL
jgi:hypothetical protein